MLQIKIKHLTIFNVLCPHSSIYTIEKEENELKEEEGNHRNYYIFVPIGGGSSLSKFQIHRPNAVFVI